MISFVSVQARADPVGNHTVKNELETAPTKYKQIITYLDRDTVLRNPPLYPSFKHEVVKYLNTLQNVDEPRDEGFRKRMERLLTEEISTEADRRPGQGRVYLMRVPIPATRSGLFICRAIASEQRDGRGAGQSNNEEDEKGDEGEKEKEGEDEENEDGGGDDEVQEVTRQEDHEEAENESEGEVGKEADNPFNPDLEMNIQRNLLAEAQKVVAYRYAVFITADVAEVTTGRRKPEIYAQWPPDSPSPEYVFCEYVRGESLGDGELGYDY